uniref:Ciliary neurotrophic factor n=1 Tax=Naja naja TaxID=35670 RepID=A0A8C6Y8N0_NAJNA
MIFSAVLTTLCRDFLSEVLLPPNQTVIQHQGSPFTDKDFHVQGLSYDGMPVATISFLEWRILSDLDRLDKNYKAYSIISEFLQLVWDDQFELNPTKDGLLNMLKDTRMQVQGLVNNLTIIISALRAPPSPVTDPLTLDVVKTNTFEKKVRGYVVCSTYKQWIDRTVRDFNLLVKKYPL